MRHLVLGLAAFGMATPAIAATNLVTNGDFEAGLAGFTSDYTYTTPDSGNNSAEGQYTVATDAYPWNTNFASYGDHTSGVGNYMVVNGAGSVANVWQNTTAISLTAGTEYVFSLALSDACCNANAFGGVDPSPPVLGVSAGLTPGDGVPLPLTFSLAPGTSAGTWQLFSGSFVAPVSGNFFFALTNQNTQAAGNDFGLDDLSLTAAVPEPASWAMMIGGFGLVGGAMRRRGASRTAVRFA